MRLVTYSETRRKPAQIGIIAKDGGIIDLARAAKKARVKLPFAADDMIALIAAGRAGLAAVKKAVAGLKTGHYAQGKVALHAPIYMRPAGCPRRPRWKTLC